MGLFYFYKSERRTREYDICCTETKETFVERYGLLGLWTLDTNFTYHLRPVFSKNNPMPSNYLECIETMNLCQDPLEFGVNDTQFSVYCNRSCLKKPTFGTISRFAVAAQHVQDCLEKRGCMNRVNLGTTKYIKERTEKVSKSQFKNELIRIQVASWYRRLRYNVDKDGNVCYVRKEGIGWVHGMYPLPPPFRMYDVITSLVITTMGVKDNSKGGTYFPRRKRNTIDRDKFKYPTDTSSLTTDILENKILFNSIIINISKGARFISLGLKDMFLITPMADAEYIKVPLRHFFPTSSPDTTFTYEHTKHISM